MVLKRYLKREHRKCPLVVLGPKLGVPLSRSGGDVDDGGDDDDDEQYHCS